MRECDNAPDFAADEDRAVREPHKDEPPRSVQIGTALLRSFHDPVQNMIHFVAKAASSSRPCAISVIHSRGDFP
jgi:hypothetical protein